MRFDNVSLWMLVIVKKELIELLRQYVSFGQEVVMGYPIFYLHFRYCFIHEVLACQMERVWEMICLLIWHQSPVDIHFKGGGRPDKAPVFIITIAVSKPILIQQTLDEPHFASHKLIEVPDFI